MSQSSDELIVDLERQLGRSDIDYIQVRLQYYHSVFPKSTHMTPINGIIDYHTQLETIVTGVLGKELLDSYQPVAVGMKHSKVFDTVSSHWGILRATELLDQGKVYKDSNSNVKHSRKSKRPSKAIKNAGHSHVETDTAQSIHTPEQKVSAELSSPQDPAHKIWTEIRRKSGHHRRPPVPTMTKRLPVASTESLFPSTPTNDRRRSSVERERERLWDIALQNQRSINAESIKSLVPSMADVNLSSKENSPTHPVGKENVPLKRESKRDGRWSLGGWW
ncbi:hypothetical protein GGR57DRAFT_435991 [Xylariaceae sp. FL1272]|nr:hypothetical protein GGR57DRAFT_435991 [Xylariaceae sp. FL1272]